VKETWKRYVGDRSMERRTIRKVGERNMERICKRKEWK